jgi:hypothetical protein
MNITKATATKNTKETAVNATGALPFVTKNPITSSRHINPNRRKNPI